MGRPYFWVDDQNAILLFSELKRRLMFLEFVIQVIKIQNKNKTLVKACNTRRPMRFKIIGKGFVTKNYKEF